MQCPETVPRDNVDVESQIIGNQGKGAIGFFYLTEWNSGIPGKENLLSWCTTLSTELAGIPLMPVFTSPGFCCLHWHGRGGRSRRAALGTELAGISLMPVYTGPGFRCFRRQSCFCRSGGLSRRWRFIRHDSCVC